MKTTGILDVNLFQKTEIEKDGTHGFFEDLILPQGYLHILRAAVASRRGATRILDAVTGFEMECQTDPGLVVLLHGPPGCGMVCDPLAHFPVAYAHTL